MSRLHSHRLAFWALVALLVACAFMGGSARADVASLMILRPFAIILLGFSLIGLTKAQWRENAFLLSTAGLILLYLVIQIIPVPYAIWSHLPGRELVVAIDQEAGLAPLWRPLSLAPDATLNALFASLVPCAALVFGVQLTASERLYLLPAVLFLIGISALLGLLQTLGPSGGSLYFYAVTNEASSVGLFANRNHQALFLAMAPPMLAVLTSSCRTQWPKYLATLTSFFVLLLILVTGSRTGLLVATMSVLAIPLLLPPEPSHLQTAARTRRHRPELFRLSALACSALLLVVLAVWFGRAIAWERLLATNSEEELRLAALPTLLSMAWYYFPIGGGSGSFVELYLIHEPDSLLSPIYFNHAHNDWLEVLLTDGLPGAIGLAGAVVAFLFQLKKVARGSFPACNRITQFHRLGLLMVLLCAVASISDYPLRTPFLAFLFVIALLWASCPGEETSPSRETS